MYTTRIVAVCCTVWMDISVWFVAWMCVVPCTYPVCLPMHVCMYSYVCIHTSMKVKRCRYLDQIYACMHTYIHTYLHAYIQPYINTSGRAMPLLQPNLCMHTYIHTNIYSHIHKYSGRAMPLLQPNRGFFRDRCKQLQFQLAANIFRKFSSTQRTSHAVSSSLDSRYAHTHTYIHTYIHVLYILTR